MPAFLSRSSGRRFVSDQEALGKLPASRLVGPLDHPWGTEKIVSPHYTDSVGRIVTGMEGSAVTGLWKPPRFRSFGGSQLSPPSRRRIGRLVIPRERMEGRLAVRQSVTQSAGVYGWLDTDDQLIYVGKAKSLRHRLLSYFAKTPADEKMARIRRSSRQIIWEPVGHELLALLREQELIHRHRPSFNVQGQPHRPQPGFVSLTAGEAPKAIVARQAAGRSGQVFGPVAGTGQLATAVTSVNYAFGLRDCADRVAMNFSDQLRLFATGPAAQCLRYELSTCPGPCASGCSKTQYGQIVRRAIEFLSGSDRSVIAQLENQMNQASRERSFEKAALLRDRQHDLQWLDRRLASLRRARRVLTGVYPLAGHGRQALWLVLNRAQIRGSFLRPDLSAQAATIERGLRAEIEGPPPQLPQGSLETNLQMLLIAWFKKHPDQRNRLISFDRAIAHLPVQPRALACA